MVVGLSKGERVRLRREPKFSGTVVARREGNVDVRWDADGCTTTRRAFELERSNLEESHD